MHARESGPFWVLTLLAGVVALIQLFIPVPVGGDEGGTQPENVTRLAFTPDKPLPLSLVYTQPEIVVGLSREEARRNERHLASIASSQANSTGGDVRAIARQKTIEAWGDSQWPAMETLIMKESGFNPKALNPSSGACGIPQALPCSKLPQGINTPVDQQIDWMIRYVKNRYGDPISALSFHRRMNWY